MRKITLAKVPFYNVLGMRYYKLLTYPLNLCYVSAALEAAGFNTQLVDGETIDFPRPFGQKLLNTGSFKIFQVKYYELIMNHYRKFLKEIMTNPEHSVWDSMIENIKKQEPDMVGITCYTVGMNGVKNLARRIKKDLKVPVILGGPHATAIPKETLEFVPDADYLVIGESEETFVELAKAIERGKTSINNMKKIDGLAFRSGEKIVVNRRRKLIEDINKIPLPNRKLIEGMPYFGDAICTSRGCPFQCIFCASKVMWGQNARYRSVDNIIKEMLELRNKYNADFIRIVDDTFTLNKKRVLEFCDKVKKNGLDKIKISLGSRVDTLDEEMLLKLKNIGVTTITFGIESGSPRIQKVIKKGITNQKVIDTLNLTNKHGIHSHVFFMVGHPTETKEDIQMSKDLCLKAKPSSIEVNIVSPYPGTPLWQMISEKKVENWYEWYHQGIAKCGTGVLTPEEVSREYKKFVWFTKIYGLKKRIGLLGKEIETSEY